MANEYLDLLNAQPAQPAAANPYLDLLNEDERRRKSALAAQVGQALSVNPEQFNQNRKVAEFLGYPLAAVEALPEDSKRQAGVRKIQQDTAGLPTLQRKYTEADFAKLAHDDSGPLSAVGRVMGDLGIDVLKGFIGLPQAIVGIADIPTLGRVGRTLESIGYRPSEAQKLLDTLYSDSTRQAQRAVGEAEGFTGTMAALAQNPRALLSTVIQSLPQMVGGAAVARGIGMAAPTLSPLFRAAVGEGTVAAGAFASNVRDQTPDRLLTPGQSAIAVGAGAGTAVLGAAGGRLAARMGLGDIDTALASGSLTGVAKPGFAKQIVGQGISEGFFEELPQSVQEQMWQNFALDRPLLDGVGNAAAIGLAAGVATGGAFGAYTAGVSRLAGQALQQSENIEQAQRTAEAMQQAMAGAEASLLRERAPNEFRSLIGEMSQDGAFHVDAEVLNQMPPEVLQQLPGVLEALPDALATNSTVEVKLADALTVLPGTPQAQTFIENARRTPDAPSLVETEEIGKRAQEFLQQGVERVIAQAADQEALRMSQEAVKTNIKEQLAATGRFRDAVNEGYATWAAAFYTAYGSRLGMTPEQFYQRYPLRVLGAPVGQQTGVLNAGAPAVELGGRQIPITLNRQDERAGFSLVPVNTAAFDTGFRAADNEFQADMYVGPGGTGAAIGDRYQRFGEFAATAPSIEAPTVSVDAQGRVSFGNGRHRFAFMRDSGVPSVPVAMDEESLQNAIAAGYVDAGVLEQRAAAPSPRARPIPPQIAAAADIGNARAIAASQQWPTNRDFKIALQEAVRAVMGQRDLRADTPVNRAYITQQLLKEAREALITNANAIGWYDEKVTTALEVVSTVHPELKTDEQAKFAFIWALAVTSNGVKVDKNFELAERSYRHWKSNNGRLPTSGVGVGPTASKIHEGLRAYNTLIERWGFERLRTFATTLQPNRDVLAAYGRKVSGEGMDTLVYGAGILGPKIGNGFFMNLNGEFGQLTMDRWWVRMWGRITGDLVEINPEATRAARDSFVALIDLIKDDPDAKRAVEVAIKARLKKSTPVETAKAIIKATSKEEARDALDLILPATPEREAAAKAIRGNLKDFVSIGDELRKAAKSYYGYLDGQIEVPGGSKRRDMMREISQAVLAELQKDNPSLTMADFQALMWYPEKTLYDSAGAQEQDSEGYDDDEAPDYANAAIKLARDQGVSDASINAAVQRARSDIAARQLAGRSGRGSAGVSPAQGAGAGGNPPGTLAQGGIDVQPQQAGDGAGRAAGAGPAPLPGAPIIAGATGPDPRIVAVAEQYARDNGIPLRRQGEYAQVDPERAARIAAAYDEMQHAPQDPAVREAYENLIRQTLAQYRALEAAGYRFWFIDPTNDPYKSPWDAMREMRASQTMGVFPTVAGFGSGATDVDVSDNPLMTDTGILWPYGSLNGELKPVLANDLFRAVHDAFGHGLEGAGFRAQGEENAWQAHVRLFTGSAVGAITSETRGQNSWLNYGPFGETNRTAKVEDTVFADQKTGLMPEWTWTEGLVPDAQPGETDGTLRQDATGRAAAGGVQRLRAGDLDVVAQYGTGIDGSVSVTGVHYSTAPRTTLAGYYYGRGLKGAESKRLTGADSRLSNRIHFYVDTGQGIRPEAGVGGYVHAVQLNNLYDTSADPLGFVANARAAESEVDGAWFNAVEQAVIDAGFDGVYVPAAQGSQGVAVLLGPQHTGVSVDQRGTHSMPAAGAATPQPTGKLRYSLTSAEIRQFQDNREQIQESAPSVQLRNGNLVFDEADSAAVVAVLPGAANARPLQQGPRGTFNPATLELVLNPNADLSTWFHETGHFFLEVLADVASQPDAPAQIVEDYNKVLAWFGVTPEQWAGYSLDQKRPYHERWAESIEQYVMEGRAPSVELQGVMRRFRAWMLSVYQSLQKFIAQRGVVQPGGETLGQSARDQTSSPEFLNWFGDSKVVDEQGSPLRMYHATNKSFDTFSPSFRGAFFVTPDAEFANDFLDNSGQTDLNEGANVMPVYVRAENPFDYENSEHVAQVIEYLNKTGLFRGVQPGFFEGGRWDSIEDRAVQKAIKELGYDSFYVNEGGVKNLGVYSRSQIKSATGNRGTFDPNDPNILKQSDQPAGSGIQLNDDIRRVMDRMLATDEQIAQANEVAGLVPDVDADGEAAERLQKRSMADLKWTVRARDKIIKALQKQAETIRKGIRAEVQAEVEQEPIYRAMRWLKKGETTDPETGELVKAEKGFRLNTEALAEMYPESALDRPDLAGLRGMTSKDGLPPDVVADMFGFASGDQLVRSILAAEPMADVVDAMTEQRMLEENGDLVDERAIQEAANEAVHNEARARSLATELRTQQEMLGQRTDTGQTNARGARVTVNALVEAAKQFGANVVARTPLRDLKATAWKHTAAERRAGKRWQEATSAGKTDEAVQAKRDQVLNNAAARASIEAQAEARKILEFFKRVTKGNDEKTVEKGRDPDIVNAARAVLAAYGVETPTTKNAVDYMERVQQNDPATFAAIEPMMTAALANAQPLEALTVEQLQGLNESIQAMWFLAKRSRQLEVDGDLLDIDDLALELNTRMEEVGIPDTIPGEASAITAAEERAQKLQFAGALLRRVEQWAEAFDGRFGGPFLRFVFQPVKDAADRYRADRLEYRKKFQALIDGVAPFMPKGEIAAPELGYTFGKGHNGIGMAELLHAILHTGNGSNKRKLLLGRGWATENADGTLDTRRWDNFLARLANEGKLLPQHYEFAQGVWDLMEQTKPLAQKTHRDVFGRYFAEVTAEPFVDPFGQTRAGGYVPAQADARIVRDAELRQLLEGENESMAYAFPQTNRGFTKSRTEYNRPLILDLRTLPQHLDKVLLFSHMEPAVRGVRRLLARPAVSQPLGRIQPAAMTGMLMPWLNRSARQIVETPIIGDGRIARAASALRNRAGMALMFGNLSNTIQQITGLSGAAVKVKPAHLLRASSALIRDRKAMLDAVWAASPYMADRANNEIAAMNQAMEQILLDASLYERAQDWTQKHAYFLQTAVDNVLSPVVWTGAYNQAIEEGMDERMAVRFADGVVRQTQGSTLPEDVSRIETGPAYARVFTQFIGYFNMMANTNGTALKQIAQDVGLKKGAGKAAYVVLTGFLLPIWIAEAIAIAFRGGPEDEDGDGYLDDWLAAVLGMGTIKGMFAQIPFVGQLANAGLNRLNNNPADDRVSLSPAVSLLEGAVGSPVSVYQAIVEDGNKQKAVRDVAALVSMATGLPASFAARSGGYLAGVASGDIQPTGPVDFARGVLTGVASPDSR